MSLTSRGWSARKINGLAVLLRAPSAQCCNVMELLEALELGLKKGVGDGGMNVGK